MDCHYLEHVVLGACVLGACVLGLGAWSYGFRVLIDQLKVSAMVHLFMILVWFGTYLSTLPFTFTEEDLAK